MGIIVDSNISCETLCNTDSVDFSPILKSVIKGRTKIIYGGTRLLEEYFETSKVMKIINSLDRAGKAKIIPKSVVDTEEEYVKSLGICVSNDTHIIALARVSGARLLCSKDKDLHKDFKNKDLIDPKGSIYQGVNHLNLIPAYC